MSDTERRAGFCAIVGRPNVGKSTLMNRLLGEKLAAVTPKPQTTRNRIMGVKNRPGAQVVYVDTPGIHKAKSSLNKYMVEQALGAVGDADVVLLLVEAPRVEADKLAGKAFDPGEGNRFIIEKLANVRKPRLLGINKVDLLTDKAERFLAAELIREQAFLLLAEELPYSLAVTIENWAERPDKKDVVIDAILYVERDSQKKIVIGEGGRMIKEIGTKARAEIGRLLQCPVHLKLFVKVDPDWTRTQGAVRRMGYE
jgi:GTP-binding protein Era